MNMSDIWKTFLLQHGAVYRDDTVVDFGNPQLERRAAREQNVIIDLATYSLIRVRGPEAKTFLNAQLTNEIGTLDEHRHVLAAWCTAQGRMLAVFRVFLRDGDYYLQVPASLRDEIIKRLRMFVLRAKVTIDALDAELVRFALAGPGAETMLREAAGMLPEPGDACLTKGPVTLLRLSGPLPRFEIIAPPAQAIALWETLQRNATPTGSGIWEWHDIMAGLPSIFPETKEAFVPQMTNLELIGGVHFKKGCYPGQEIVARMQYLGRLKQRMLRAHVAADAAAPGTPIFAPDMPGQSAGTVVNAQPSPEGGSDLLAVIQLSSVQGGELHLGTETGPRLRLESLPYKVNVSNSN